MNTTLSDQLEQRGWKGRVVSIERLHDVQNEIKDRQRTGDFDAAFSAYLDTQIDFEPPEDLHGVRSLIIVAARDPQVRFSFSWNGGHKRLVVPPTYLHGRKSDERVEAMLTEILEPEGYQVRRATLPKKLLAVRSGLAEYGKNNVAFMPGWGSFVRFSVFFSDLPCRQDGWRESRLMDRCQDCSACRNICPTGAIPMDRILLRADLCTTYHNEQPIDIGFPAWLEPGWHNCIVGCLHCQRVCPENKDVTGWIEEGAEFSPEETLLFLQGNPLDQLPQETADKLEQWDLTQFLELFPRNLKVLLDPVA
jgi:epoxyqueuosine reductase